MPNKGMGVRATRNIACGETILDEKPALCTTMRQVFLARESRKEELHAFDIMREGFKSLSEVMNKREHILSSPLTLTLACPLQEEAAGVMSLADQHEEKTNGKTVSGILETNSVGSSQHDACSVEEIMTVSN